MAAPESDYSRTTPPKSALSFSLVIPTLNEAENIERMIRSLDSVLVENGVSDYEILVVDDNSHDGTAQIAERLASEFPEHIQVIHHTGKASLGTSAVTGWQAAHGKILGLMDADFQHPPEVIPRLVAEIHKGNDIAIGSRYAKGGAISREWNPVRKLVSLSMTGITRLLLGRSLDTVRDPFSGCFVMRKEVITGKSLHPEGFKVLMEVLAVGNYQKVVEVPISFSPRFAGESKLRLQVAIDDFLLLLRLVWQTRRKH